MAARRRRFPDDETDEWHVERHGGRSGALMSRNPQDGWRPPEPPNRPPRPSMPPRGPSGGGNPRSRWMPWVVVGVITLAFIVIFSNGLPGSSTARTKLTFNELQT